LKSDVINPTAQYRIHPVFSQPEACFRAKKPGNSRRVCAPEARAKTRKTGRRPMVYYLVEETAAGPA